MTPEGLPLAYEVLPGNTADNTTLRGFLQRIERQYGKARRVWLMDRGVPTEEVLAEMRGNDPPVHYLVGTPKGRLTRLEKPLVAQPWHEARPGVQSLPRRRPGSSCCRSRVSSMSSISAITAVGLAILPGSAFAQTKSLKQQLEGSYTLAKAFDTSSDGKDNDVWGPGVQGSLILDPSGHFSLFIVAANRAKGESNDPRVPVGNIVAHYGTYTVDETAKTINYHYERSTFPQWDGIDRKATIQSFTGTELSVAAAPAPNPKLGTVIPHQVWKRTN